MKLGAFAWLGWRALVAHPLRRLVRRGSGAERFALNYESEGLTRTRPEDRAVAEAAAACIGCGLCETGCQLAASPSVRSLGLHAAFRLYSRSSVDLPHALEALEACAGCAGCEALCPTGVPIGRVVGALLGRARDLGARAGRG
ncbi:MAG TPA: 4Fe-4S dicluster domain-containing protein [Anaeromyxobacteraceae bacterium]|nr:4Fe-4S dicluster domain-containing protein [Anaeromyxobacteraceae bacterium]